MQKIKKLTTLLLLLLFITFSSCKKDKVDTPALSNTELLTLHVWRFEKTINQVGNTQTSYERGGINTTGSNYDAGRFEYKIDGTGILTDGDNNQYPFTWSFASGNETKMTVIVDYGTKTISFALSFMLLTPDSFAYTQSYSEGGTQVLSSTKLIPAL